MRILQNEEIKEIDREGWGFVFPCDSEADQNTKYIHAYQK